MLEEEDLLKSIEDDCWNDLLDDFNKFTDYIKNFEKNTPEDFQVCAVIDGVIFILDKLSISRQGQFILIEGHLTGGESFLNVRQSCPLNLSLLRRRKVTAKEPRQKIGFSIHCPAE